jgi:cation transporter-like permease
MADTALQRTVNRGIALIVLPLSALVLGFENWVWSDVYGANIPGVFGTLAYSVVPTLLFVGALVYLATTAARGLVDRLDPDEST